MHGLINRGFECFVRDTYGDAVWDGVTQVADLGFSRFEAMMHYEDGMTQAILDAASARLSVPVDMLLEDLGTYLVASPTTEAIRRLMRFAGASFEDFLHSIEDLPDRARLAVPDLVLPPIDLTEEQPGVFRLTVGPGMPGFATVLAGMLRTMADDYGALAVVESDIGAGERAMVRVMLLDQAFAEGRRFDLAVTRGGR
ncbi:MAG: heme NO-binding domain-containing protein [Rhodobacteraceae bacterium]|jgi:hypothetical protein|nr:heme NO-binding domain-containing protein [Paracoccaceae bacterium]